MARFWKKMKERIPKLGDRMDRYQGAVTFAEAGETGLDYERIEEEPPEERRGKLVVIGRESSFSEDVKEYALEMAQRLSYEIVALNTASLSCETFQKCKEPRDEVLALFKSDSEESAGAFRQQAEELGIPFTHVVKYLDPDQATQELYQELGGIEFIISEAEEDQPAQRPQDREEARQGILVYSMV